MIYELFLYLSFNCLSEMEGSFFFELGLVGFGQVVFRIKIEIEGDKEFCTHLTFELAGLFAVFIMFFQPFCVSYIF